MKYLINIFLWVSISVLMSSAGITVNKWQYWAVYACVYVMCLNIATW